LVPNAEFRRHCKVVQALFSDGCFGFSSMRVHQQEDQNKPFPVIERMDANEQKQIVVELSETI
jgi:hypothetical protein